MGIYLGANALGGGGSGAPIGSYGTFNIDTSQSRIETSDGSIWLKTGDTLSEDGTGSSTDAATYPDALSFVGPGNDSFIITANSSQFGSDNNGIFFNWWEDKLIFAQEGGYQIFNNIGSSPGGNPAPVLTADASGSIGNGAWFPGFYDAAANSGAGATYSMQALAGSRRIGESNPVTLGTTQVVEVTGEWPNYTAVSGGVSRTLPSSAPGGATISHFQGWATDGNNLIIGGKTAIFRWNNWKTASVFTVDTTDQRYGVVSNNNSTYWRVYSFNNNPFGGVGDSEIEEYNISDGTPTGKSINLSGGIGGTLGDFGVQATPLNTDEAWWGLTAHSGNNQTYKGFVNNIGDPTAKFSRSFSNSNSSDSINLTHPIYVKIGNATT